MNRYQTQRFHEELQPLSAAGGTRRYESTTHHQHSFRLQGLAKTSLAISSIFFTHHKEPPYHLIFSYSAKTIDRKDLRVSTKR